LFQSSKAVLTKIFSPEDDALLIGTQPSSFINYPLFDGFGENRTLVATILSELSWINTFTNFQQSTGMFVVVSNACQQSITFQLNCLNMDYIVTWSTRDRGQATGKRSAISSDRFVALPCQRETTFVV
jgi:hypothetical protein